MFEKLCSVEALSKTRHEVEFAGHVWEVDEFHAANQGLIVAEIELPDDTTEFTRPAWLGLEVTNDFRYRNSNLYTTPWTSWDAGK